MKKLLLAAFFAFSLLISSSQLSLIQAQEEEGTSEGFVAPEGPTQETFDAFNPLKEFKDDSITVEQDLSTPGGILSRVLVFAFPIAGLILFVMLIWAGFEMLSGAATKKSLDAGRQRATAAIIGFGLLFVSYWIVKIIEVVFGIKVF